MADYALQYDGSQNYGSIAGIAAYNVTNSFAISCWFNSNVIPSTSDQVLYDREESTTNRILLKIAANTTKLRWNLTATSTSSNVTTSSNILQNQTYHNVLTYDGTNIRMYVNNSLDGSTPQAFSSTFSFATADALKIGQQVTSNAFSGVIDDFKFYNVNLSAQDVTALYNHGTTSQEANLIGAWNFNEGSGTVFADSSTQKNNGNLIGTPGPNWVTGFLPSTYIQGWGISNANNLAYKATHIGTVGGTTNINYNNPTFIGYIQLNNLALGTVVLYDSVGTSANIIGSTSITSLSGSSPLIPPLFQNLSTKNGLTIANTPGLDLTIAYLS